MIDLRKTLNVRSFPFTIVIGTKSTKTLKAVKPPSTLIIMKVAVSSTGEDLKAPVDPRFGRCAFFLLVDTESMDFEALANEGTSSVGGAGIAAAQQVADKGAEAVITGDVGPNAMGTLTAAGMKVITGASGTVEEAVKGFLKGDLTEATGATVVGHHGMGGGGGGGMGRGMGGGR